MPDGNCMLDSVFPHLRNNQITYVDLRVLLVQSFNGNWNDFAPFFESSMNQEEEKKRILAEVGTDGMWNIDTMDLVFHALSKSLHVGKLYTQFLFYFFINSFLIFSVNRI